MITRAIIENYKSVKSLKIELGRFNVFIGENGCGKSNILEAIAFGAAASSDKLDNEFLQSRGIRLTEPSLFRSAFSKNFDSAIKLGLSCLDEKEKDLFFELQHNNEFNGRWVDKDSERKLSYAVDFVSGIITGNKPDSFNDEEWVTAQNEISKDEKNRGIFSALSALPDLKKSLPQDFFKKIFENEIKKTKLNDYLTNFKIFSPENTFLRRLETEKTADPLSIRGEGLFELLKEYSHNDIPSFEKIKEGLSLIEWFGDFEVSSSTGGDRLIKIKDRHIDEQIDFIPQNNANEGFLFLLFYLSLYVSKDTPRFFAIDNIEASFHPKLCKKLTKVLVALSKSEDKQSIVTTHNPFILDGLDLSDPEQRLFVIYRNRNGETKAKRIEHAERNHELSHAWMNGFLGGVPSNFAF